ncbi:MAG: hypothetical protein ACK6CT_13040, partial [Planctomycetia bacterium]
MSVIRPKPPVEPLHVAGAAAYAAGGHDGERLAPLLGAARADLLAAVDASRATAEDHAGRPADAEAAGIDLPDRLLAAYTTSRPQSELYAILQAAHRMRDEVDRLIVIGAGGCHYGPRLLFETCCHPLHNELSRGDRGGRPRVSFAGDAFDDDLV